MLADKDAMATIAVKDIATAKRFYGGVLGLEQAGGKGREAVTYRSGNSLVVVYRSEFAGTNKATSATWSLGDQLEAVVQSLKRAGIAFEHYDVPGLRREGDIHYAGDFKAAWFKDPDGNILHINSG